MRRGQGILEYAFMIGIAAAVIIAMAAYAKRGFQGYVRGASEQIGSGQYSTNNTTANKNVIKNISSTSVSTSTSTISYGNGGAESPEMRANKEQQRQLRLRLAALNAEKHGISGDNAVVNQAATDTENLLAGISATGIANIITDAQRATTLAAIDNSIVQVNAALTQVETAYTDMEHTRNRLRDADYGDDGMPDSVRQQIAELNAQMRENLVLQGQLRDALANLAVARQNAMDASNATTAGPAIPPVVIPYDTPITLAQIQADIDAITTALADLATAYTTLSDAWTSRVITPDQTTSNSSNIETGTQTTNSLTDESLGSLGNDTWRR